LSERDQIASNVGVFFLVLDDEIATRTTAAKNYQFWPAMRKIITQMLEGTT